MGIRYGITNGGYPVVGSAATYNYYTDIFWEWLAEGEVWSLAVPGFPRSADGRPEVCAPVGRMGGTAMSAYAAFRRQPVPQQFAQNLHTITIPAPTRGIIQSENEAFMQPGGANVQTNWATTMKGVKLRGGCTRWCELPETTPIISAFEYSDGNVQKMYAANATKLFDVTTGTPSPDQGRPGQRQLLRRADEQQLPATTS